MRVSIGATHYAPDRPSGLNRYTGGLLSTLPSLLADTVIYTADESGKGDDVEAEFRVTGPTALRKGNFVGNVARLIWHQTRLPRLLRSDGSDLYFCPIAEGMLRPRVPQIVTVHDLLPLLFPEDNPRLKYYYRFILPRIVRASASVIAVSESTRADIHRLIDADADVRVVYQGYRSDIFRPQPEDQIARVRQKYGLQKYLIAVGETRRYKNIRGLISAFAEARPPGLSLAIVGKINRLDTDLTELPNSLGIGGSVKFLGTVPDDDLAPLYAGATALVFPSQYEGFGIPPLEAMACGCPVIASNTASLPEVCGDAAIYVDPTSRQDIARSISAVADGEMDLTQLRERGWERCRRFSYRQMAEDTASILSEHEGRAVRPSGAATG